MAVVRCRCRSSSSPAAKVVRGAYLISEAERAAATGQPSPLHGVLRDSNSGHQLLLPPLTGVSHLRFGPRRVEGPDRPGVRRCLCRVCSLTSHCLCFGRSLPLHCLYTAFPWPSTACIPPFLHCLSLAFYCPYTAVSSLPFLGLSRPLCCRSLASHCLRSAFTPPLHRLYTAFQVRPGGGADHQGGGRLRAGGGGRAQSKRWHAGRSRQGLLVSLVPHGP